MAHILFSWCEFVNSKTYHYEDSWNITRHALLRPNRWKSSWQFQSKSCTEFSRVHASCNKNPIPIRVSTTLQKHAKSSRNLHPLSTVKVTKKYVKYSTGFFLWVSTEKERWEQFAILFTIKPHSASKENISNCNWRHQVLAILVIVLTIWRGWSILVNLIFEEVLQNLKGKTIRSFQRDQAKIACKHKGKMKWTNK